MINFFKFTSEISLPKFFLFNQIYKFKMVIKKYLLVILFFSHRNIVKI